MHSCPECGQACYCGGDIDDCPVDTEAEDNCEHGCGPEDDDLDALGSPGYEDCAKSEMEEAS